MSHKNQTGGFVSINYLIKYFKSKNQNISFKDIQNAISKINILGSEIEIFELSDKNKYIGMCTIKQNQDLIEIIQLFKVLI